MTSACNCGSHIKALEPVAILATPVDFGAVPVGESGRQHFKVSNQGSGVLTLRSFAIDSALFGGPEVLDGGPALSTLTVAAGESTEIEVAYTPTAPGTAASPDTGTLSAATNDPTHPTVHTMLTGFGTQAAFTVAPTMLAFGDVQLTPGVPLTPPMQSVTLTNVGSAFSHVTGVTLASDDAGSFSTTPGLDTLAGGLAPGQSLTVHVSFAPTDLVPHAGTLAFLTDYPAQPELDVPLSGQGVETLWQLCRQLDFDDGGADAQVCVPAPADSIDGGAVVSVNFGARDEDGPPAHARVWAQNVGNQALALQAVLLDIPQQDPCPGGPYPSAFSFASTTPDAYLDGGTFGIASLDAGEQASMEVTYTAQHHCATGGYPDGGGPNSDDVAATAQLRVSRTPLAGTRTYVCIVEGHSALPAIEAQSFNFAGFTSPDAGVPVIVQNGGEKQLTVSAVELDDAQGVSCATSTAPECRVIDYAGSAALPLVVPPASATASDGGTVFGTGELGLLYIRTDGGILHGSLDLTTDDPHHPTERFPITLQP